jgi:hypothetical protein
LVAFFELGRPSLETYNKPGMHRGVPEILIHREWIEESRLQGAAASHPPARRHRDDVYFGAGGHAHGAD